MLQTAKQALQNKPLKTS
jgi:hypothetical protein